MENDDTVKTTDDGTGETELEGESKIVVEHEDKQDEEAEGVKKKSEEGKERDKDKINIRLNAVGNAPILRQKLWAVPADREVGQIVEFVKKYLKLEKHQSLFLFVNQAFAPSPDQPLRELYECFGADGKIVFHYSTTYAWG
ncbi:autophagy protein 12-like [Folsomia candida]|uniref:autophagy protein 12-like n=1 Tax=Folsomia candida TaxID=158441 RepID=UPI000B8FF8AA|nr:autophagy protein 12-like [Folsomia candida]